MNKYEKDLERAYKQGYRQGKAAVYARALEKKARQLLGQDKNTVTDLIHGSGIMGALSGLRSLVERVVAPRWVSGLSPILEDVMQEASAPQAAVLGTAFTLSNPAMKDYFDNYTLKLAGDISETTRKNVADAIRKAIEEGDSASDAARRIEAVFEDATPARAERIARTELNRAANAANYLQAKESGIAKTKTWLTAHDERVRPEHRALEGVTVDVTSLFPNGLEHPSEPNCRCTLTFGIDLETL